MSEGWIKLHRKIIENPVVWDDPEVLKVWLFFLIEAASQERDVIFKGDRTTLKPGQFISSVRIIASKTGIDRSKIHRIINRLKSETQVETQNSNKNTLFTIKNWSAYQKRETQNATQVRHKRDTSETQNKKDKKDKNIKNNISPNTIYINNTNVASLVNVLNGGIHPDTGYLSENRELYALIRDWMEYKDGKQPKSSNHYDTVQGISRLITKFVRTEKEYGLAAVHDAVDTAISNNWMGIAWEKATKNKKQISTDVIDNW